MSTATLPTTLADVLEGLEPGDKLTYCNRHGQVMRGTVERVYGRLVVMSRPEWRALGFGPETLEPSVYELVACGWLDDDAVCAFRAGRGW